MEKFNETQASADFVASGDSRETSPYIMRAIAFFARNVDEAEAIWNLDAIGTACTISDIWEHATSNGTRDVNLSWGCDGERIFADYVEGN